MGNDTDPDGRFTRRSFVTASGLTVAGAMTGAAAGRSDAPVAVDQESGGDDGPVQEVVVRQDPGRTFYWVLPGPRRLSPHVFGTPDNPRMGRDHLEARIQAARQLPGPAGDTVAQLLEDLPILVAAPEESREPVEDDDAVAHEVYAEPTPFGDEARVTEGSFEIAYRDHRPYDLPGEPGTTPDTVELDATFADPAGNEYELEVDHVVQPPVPGYETGGGVLVDARHHGTTETGSPLMAGLYNYGAVWAVGNVLIDGEVAAENKLLHFMTTQVVRDARYNLAIDEELPLAPDNTIAGQIHHTHGIVLPITATPEGPVFEPVETAFELPNGETQPFIHAMWEQDEIVEGPFADWSWPETDETPAEDGDADETADADFRLGGEASGWVGRAPAAIADEQNPTLTLDPDTEYVLVWENVDGIQHNFAIEDENGEDVVATELVGEEGATQTVAFTASEEMAEYYCQVHPNTMRGDVELSS